jgi:hypothetical protein
MKDEENRKDLDSRCKLGVYGIGADPMQVAQEPSGTATAGDSSPSTAWGRKWGLLGLWRYAASHGCSPEALFPVAGPHLARSLW